MPSRRVASAVGTAAAAVAVGAGTCALSGRARLDDMLQLGLASLGLESFLALVAVAGALLSTRPVVERLGLGRSRLGGGGIALLVLGTLAFSHGFDALLDLTGWREQSSLARFETLLAGVRGLRLATALVAVGLAPGIAEELLCRGLVQRGLEPVLGTTSAVVLGALFFGALHLDPVHAAFATLLGLYLGASAALAGSVRVAILCHVVNNAVAVMAAAGAPDLAWDGVSSVVGGFALAAACFWGAARHTRGAAAPPAPASSSSGAAGLQVDARSDDP